MKRTKSLFYLILILASPHAWSNGGLFLGVRSEPTEFAAPVEVVEPIAPAPAPVVEEAPAAETSTTKSPFGFCSALGCIKMNEDGTVVAPKPVNRPKRTDGPPTVRELCYGQFMLDAAIKSTKHYYNNRDYFAGFCAEGVNHHLVWAGVKRPGQIESPIAGTGYLDAYEYHYRGTLKALGFRDIYYPGMQPEDAPAGAVLIFSGPLTEEYEATNGTLPPKSQRGGMSAGNWVGHIAIKGSNSGEDADKYYYTDGRTRRPAVRKRYLAAVYIFTECVECNLDAINKKKACDDAYLEE